MRIATRSKNHVGQPAGFIADHVPAGRPPQTAGEFRERLAAQLTALVGADAVEVVDALARWARRLVTPSEREPIHEAAGGAGVDHEEGRRPGLG